MSKLMRFLIKVVITFVIFSAAMMTLVILIYNTNFGIRFEAYRTITEHEAEISHFYSGQNRLTGYMFGTENDLGLIVISHGLGGGAASYLEEINFFVANGWRVFAFDKTGSHNSEGRGTRGLPQSALDLNASLDYITSLELGLPIVLYGHSWGGFAVTAILNFDHNIKAVVSLAGFAEPMSMLHESARAMLGALGDIAYPFIWIYQQILFGEYANLSAIDGINNGNVPVKIIHGNTDDVISYDGTGIIAYQNEITNPNATFILKYHPNFSGHNNLTHDPSLLAEINEFFLYNLLLNR